MFDQEFRKTASQIPIAGSSRRQIERLPCDRSLIGSLILPQTTKPVEVWIRDLSTEGVGIMTASPVEVDRIVMVGLARSQAVPANRFLAKVVHCSAESECCWYIGCRFQEPLDEAVMRYLVG